MVSPVAKSARAASVPLDDAWEVRSEALSLDGPEGLAMVQQARDGWMPALVPGEIHLDLVRAGKMEEPLVSTNAPKGRWVEDRSWWYRKTFTVTKDLLDHERIQLVFEGLDLYAQIFLNGIPTGKFMNAFVPAVFNAKPFLRLGQNELVVRLTVGTELAPAPAYTDRSRWAAQTHLNRFNSAASFLRKPQFSYGYDWVDALPNIGITRPVHLEGQSWVVLHDLRIDTVAIDNRHERCRARLEMAAVVENLHVYEERAVTLEISIVPPSGDAITRRHELLVPAGRVPVYDAIEIPDAQLWWPNGMGNQPLYAVTARVLHGKRETDRKKFSIGLRKITIDRTALPEGSRFCIAVNGREVFCRGGNWIPTDAIIPRADAKKHNALVAAARDANFTMLRLWGGGVFESRDFYEACDRAGILLWHDFMFAVQIYPDSLESFRNAVRAEVEAAIPALRHHPSIALWCGNNENIWGFCDWWNDDKDMTPNHGGSVLYNQILPDACRLLDPHRFYWPGSPFGGPTPNSETAGDCHWWFQYRMHSDVERHLHPELFDECRARFVSEYGAIGPCCLESIREYLKPDELERESLAWRVHTNMHEKKDTLDAAIRHHYAEPASLSNEDYVLYGQLFQSQMYERSVEALRFRKLDPVDDCAGALIWMYDDCWGETGWSVIDYYLRRKASFYGMKRACEPLKAIVRRRGNRLVTRVVNDGAMDFQGVVRTGWLRIDGSDKKIQKQAVRVPVSGMLQVVSDVIPRQSKIDPRQWIYAAWLEDKSGMRSSPSVVTLSPIRDLAIVTSDIRVRTSGRYLELECPVFCHAVHANDGGAGDFSDNYFDLLPGVPTRIERRDGKTTPARFKAVAPFSNRSCCGPL